MSKISSMMDVGKRSMMNSQTALQTVGHNIANKSTEGYSRQRVEIEANPPVDGGGKIRIGTGARATGVTRINNPYLEKQIGQEQSNLGFMKERSDSLSRVEQVFNEQVNKGLNSFMGEFFNSFREFSNNPESMASRTLVKESADVLAKDFHRVNKQLRQIQGDIDFQVTSQVQEINNYTKQIAELNAKIQQVEVTGASANDERDRRDLLIKKLGEMVDIRWAEGRDGMVTISSGGSALLVAGHDAKELQVKSTPGREGKREGNVDIYFLNTEKATPVLMTNHFKGGSLGALLEVRDHTINGLLDDLDKMAYQFASAVNEAHTHGFDRYDAKGAHFFSLPQNMHDASEKIEVNREILNDVGRIAAAANSNAPGDNTIANIIAQLQYKPIMGDGVTNVNDFYNGIVGKVGALTRRANTAQEAQEDIVKQLNNIRESISGVSLDEETTKMIEFQKGFDASARLIRTADELLDTVLNLKRL